MKGWHLTACPALSVRDRLRLLLGVPLYVRFTSPDGQCHAACHLSVVVQHDWPANTGELLRGWPPRVRVNDPAP